MATITLTKAARLQERLREMLREVKREPTAAVSIFIDEPQTELDRLSQKLLRDVGRVEQLLAVLADLRAAVGRANAECGISALLAEKAGLDERVELLSKLLPGSATKRERYPLAADLEVRPWRDREALTREIAAMRTRFSSAERGAPAASIDADLPDEAAVETVRGKITTARRRLEEIGDRLRELNGTVTIVLADAALNRVGRTAISIRGSKEALAQATEAVAEDEQAPVPLFVQEWRREKDRVLTFSALYRELYFR